MALKSSNKTPNWVRRPLVLVTSKLESTSQQTPQEHVLRKHLTGGSETYRIWTPDLKAHRLLWQADACVLRKLCIPDSKWDGDVAEQGLFRPLYIGFLDPGVTTTTDFQVRALPKTVLEMHFLLVWNLNEGQVLRDYRPHPVPSTTIPHYGKKFSPNNIEFFLSTNGNLLRHIMNGMSLVGNVGGTLGMFISFSFLGATEWFFDYAKKLWSWMTRLALKE